MVGTNSLFVAGVVVSYRSERNTAVLSFASALPPGLYQAVLAPSIADPLGNTMAQAVWWTFWAHGQQDSDNDGVPDSLEAALGYDPLSPDSDGNGICDGDEDRDGDGLPNKWEVLLGYNPLVQDSDGNGVRDDLEDWDRDGLNNRDELLAGTNPRSPDTDGDGWTDEAELTAQSDPLNPDSRPRFVLAGAPPSVSLFVAASPVAGALGSVVANPPAVSVFVAASPTLQALGPVAANPSALSLFLAKPLEAQALGAVAAKPAAVSMIVSASPAPAKLSTTPSRPPVSIQFKP
jgi:hypothetical protein